MKLRPFDVHTAFDRVVEGEPVTRVASAYNVTEGALRWRFKREGWDAGEVRRAAWGMFAAQMAYDALSARERLKADRLMEQARRRA